MLKYTLAHDREHFYIKMQLWKGMDCGISSFQTPWDVWGDRPFVSASASNRNISFQKTITAHPITFLGNMSLYINTTQLPKTLYTTFEQKLQSTNRTPLPSPIPDLLNLSFQEFQFTRFSMDQQWIQLHGTKLKQNPVSSGNFPRGFRCGSKKRSPPRSMLHI